MENKKQQNNFTGSRACLPSEPSVRKSSSDLQVNKPWPRNTRRREQPSAIRNDSQRNSKQYTTVKSRLNVDKRSRQRGYNGDGGKNYGNSSTLVFDQDGITCPTDDISTPSAGLATVDEPVVTGALTKKKFRQHVDYEQNSVYAPGSKKQNLNHLLNFHYAPREDNAFGYNVFGRSGGSNGVTKRHGANGGVGKRQRFNKEQFLQANFQFVVNSSVKLNIDASPDYLIDWHLIDQINIQTEEEPQCPICLYPPIAAKLTRCGHAYCWPCILHYLALSDKTWRKCPICYEAIHIADLKSTTILQHRQFSIGDEITFQLMHRKKGCLIIEKFKPINNFNNSDNYPLLSSSDERKRFSKFLIAKRNDIVKLIEREHNELIAGQDPNSPEYVFIQQALDLLKERREQVEKMVYVEEPIAKNVVIENNSDGNIEHIQIEKDIENVIDHDENSEKLEIEQDFDNEERTESSVSFEENIYSTSTNIDNETGNNVKYYYFYQSVDGQNIYLHPLNIKMLQACYGTLAHAPLIISARVVQKEYHSMDEEHRRKFTCLGHLPLTCQFAVIEVDLQPPFVSDETLRLFKDDILMRKKDRMRRDREERRREKKINEINDRQMGKLIASTVNLNLTSTQEFPTWGFEALPSRDADAAGGVDVSISSNPTAIPKSNRQATYSTVAVVGESPRPEEYWPTLSSPTGNNRSNMYQELSSWGKSTSVLKQVALNNTNRKANSNRSSECESIEDSIPEITPMSTDLGDVLAIAMSKKKQNVTATNVGQVGNGKNKNKKAKKLVPLFSTGINYNGK